MKHNIKISPFGVTTSMEHMKNGPSSRDNVPETSQQNVSGYQQIYVVKKQTKNAPRQLREVFFTCGKWCYDGFVDFEFLRNNDMTISNLPQVAGCLQENQDSLSFICTSDSAMDESKSFSSALHAAKDANAFLASEITLPSIMARIKDNSNFDEGHYFELVADTSSLFAVDDIECICTKTYTKGLCFVSFYFEGIFYAVLQDASDDVALLDVEFPHVTRQGNGVTLALYDNNDGIDDSTISWKKLSLWRSVPDDTILKEPDTSFCLSSPSYIQSYAVLKPNKPDASMRDVLFRFGSWCYNGVAELIPELKRRDIQYLIPAVRAQQYKLAFLCHSSEMSADNLFTEPLTYVSNISQLMEREVIASADTIKLLQQQSKLDIDEDPENLFFEFKPSPNTRSILAKSHIDCIATKCYRPNGVIIMNIYFDGVFYVCMSAGNENQPLLDSSFPSILQGKGFQLKVYPAGIDGWPELRKLSLWKNHESLDSSPNSSEIEPVDVSTEAAGDTPKGDTRDSPNQSNEVKHESKSTRMSNPTHDISNEHTAETLNVAEHKESNTFMICKERKHSNPRPKAIINHIAESKDGTDIGYSSLHVINKLQSKKQNLGSVHHLAPLRKTSDLEKQLKNSTHKNVSRGGPWDSEGRPKL